MKKILVLFLALIMALGVLAACGPKPSGPSNPSGEQQYDEEAPLPRTTYNGKTYTVLYRQGQQYEEEWISDETRKGDVINDAIASRNQAVIDRYGVMLDYESGKVPTNSFENDFWAKVTTNRTDDIYQLLAGYTYRLAKVSVQGYCLNWLNPGQIPEVSTSAEKCDWWDIDFIQAAKYNGCTYIATGPLSLTDMYSSACLFFNKELLNQYKGPDATDELFALVNNGGWTLEKMMEYAADCTETVEGDETGENTIFGLTTTQSTMIDAYIYASDITMTYRDTNGVIKLTKMDSNNRILDLSETLKKLYNVSGHAKLTSSLEPEHVQLLCEGKAVFAAGTLSSAKDIQTYASQLQYGVIPYPKYNAEQEKYHTYKLDYKTGFCIPRSVKENNREFVGTITEALAYYSNKFVKPALYEKVLTHKLVQEKASSDSVTMILNGGLYEFANIYSGAWGGVDGPAHLLRKVVQKNLNFSSEYSTNYRNGRGPYQTFLTTLLNSFKSDDVSAE